MQAYVSGNKLIGKKGEVILNSTDDAWAKGYAEAPHQTLAQSKVDQPFFPNYITLQTADEAYKSVLADVGANAQGLDYLDTRYVKETSTGTYTCIGSKDGRKGFIDSQNDAGGYPTAANFTGGTAPADSDHDGMSDAWEKEHGLDANDAADGSEQTLSSDGYTNVEMYLNELAGDPVEYNGIATIEPINGTLIRELRVLDTANAAGWSIQTKLADGSLVYGDRDAAYTAVPTLLQGAEFIATACDSKSRSGDLATFTAGADCTVYVAMDSRVTTAPAWLGKWTRQRTTIENSKGVVYNIYSLACRQGDAVTLGTNGQSSGCVGYTVFAVAGAAAVVGDVNLDGTVNVADALLLQRHLVRSAELTTAQAQAADLDADKKLTAMDLVRLKRLLVK